MAIKINDEKISYFLLLLFLVLLGVWDIKQIIYLT